MYILTKKFFIRRLY